MTYGEAAVGLSFNPSGDPVVDRLKRLYAEIIDLCDAGRHPSAHGAVDAEQARLYSVAITKAQTAQMWAVKAVTWKGW
jgi:hypothetical protein